MLQWRQRGGFRGRLSPFCAGKQWLGPAKKPRRERTGEVRPPSRARNQVREPRRRKTRPPAQGRARRIRAQKRVPSLEGAQAGGGAEGREWNGMGRRERYAGAEPQSFGGGMRNMTSHDTVQGSSMNRPACGGESAPAVSCAQSGARTAPAQDAQAGGGAHAGYARKNGSAAWGRPGRRRRGRKGAERNAAEGTICRNGTARRRRRHGEHDIS